ncbi:MAG: hypothetical protein R2991_02030 [Thermoanaerobaculia bacterium]
MTIDPHLRSPFRRIPGSAVWLPALALALTVAACGGGAPEADSAAPVADAGDSAPTTAGREAKEEGAGGKIERQIERSRQTLDRLEGLVDGLTPEERLEFDDAVAELERRRDEAVAAAGAKDLRPAKLRRLSRELAKVADEAAQLAAKAEAAAGG